MQNPLGCHQSFLPGLATANALCSLKRFHKGQCFTDDHHCPSPHFTHNHRFPAALLLEPRNGFRKIVCPRALPLAALAWCAAVLSEGIAAQFSGQIPESTRISEPESRHSQRRFIWGENTHYVLFFFFSSKKNRLLSLIIRKTFSLSLADFKSYFMVSREVSSYFVSSQICQLNVGIICPMGG